MNRKLYLVLFAVVMAMAATGFYVRQRAKSAALAALQQGSGPANCDTPAPPPAAPSRAEGPPATPPPNLPGFAIEAGCGTGAEAPKATMAPTAPKAPPTGKTGKAK